MELSILEPFAPLGGKVGFYYKSLVDGDSLICNGDMPLLAASVIKLPVMAEAFRQMEAGLVNREERFTIRAEDKLPSCGALNVMHDGLEVTFYDLVTLMIVFSDNAATNLVIKRLGMDAINANIASLGLTATRLNRLLFDSAAAKQGLENRISASDMGKLLELIYRGELVSQKASEEMLEILLNQKLNGKLPLSLPRGTEIAHKTGEDSGITHDVGIVMENRPYVICICSNEIYAPDFDRAIHEVSLRVWAKNQQA